MGLVIRNRVGSVQACVGFVQPFGSRDGTPELRRDGEVGMETNQSFHWAILPFPYTEQSFYWGLEWMDLLRCEGWGIHRSLGVVVDRSVSPLSHLISQINPSPNIYYESFHLKRIDRIQPWKNTIHIQYLFSIYLYIDSSSQSNMLCLWRKSDP